MINKNAFFLKVITPEGSVLEKEAQFIRVPGKIGEIGVIQNHSPSLATLKAGEVKIRLKSEPKDSFYFIPDGMVHILKDSVTILTSYLENVKEIDKLRAGKARQRAQDRIKKSEPDIDSLRAEKALERAEVRLKIWLYHQ